MAFESVADQLGGERSAAAVTRGLSQTRTLTSLLEAQVPTCDIYWHLQFSKGTEDKYVDF